jgi:tellurite methyltransferase
MKNKEGALKRLYNGTYSEIKDVFGGEEPEAIVKNILEYKTKGSVLEIGAGQGRNSLFLAGEGFDVTAQDLSQVGIDQIAKKAADEGFKIKTAVGDIRDFHPTQNFDVVVSTYMLQHFSREEIFNILKNIQEHTNINGLHAITVFTQNGDLANKHNNQFYPEENELKKLYIDANWEILEYKISGTPTLDKKSDGKPMQNTTAELLARRIK